MEDLRYVVKETRTHDLLVFPYWKARGPWWMRSVNNKLEADGSLILPLPPSLHQLSIFRVFKATGNQTRPSNYGEG